MKKVFCFLIVFVMICGFAVPQAHAAQDLNQTFKDAVWLLDGFGFEYNAVYMHYIVCRELYTDEIGEGNDYGEVKVSAEEYETTLYKYFAVTDAQLSQIREYEAFYDEADQTYTITYIGGYGGAPADFVYQGYITNGDGYDIYSVGMKHTYLNSSFDTYDDYQTYLDALDWPESVTYEGVVYDSAYGDYIHTEQLDTGRKYHVQLNGDVVKFFSCENYTKDQLPEKFEPIVPQVTVTLPSDGSVSLPNTEKVFADGTQVTVSVISDAAVVDSAKTALSEIATEFVVYDFSAVKGNMPAQPDGGLKVVFAIPAGYSNDISVYYMDDAGNLELLESEVSKDGKSVSVTLEHFSKYLLTDNSTKPVVAPTEPSQPTEPSTAPTQPAESSQPATQPSIQHGNDGSNNRGTDAKTILWIFIIVAAAAVVVVCVIIITMLARKRK